MNNRILSLDIPGLTSYVVKRFNKNLLKTEDLQEVRDLSFQILGNKEGFRNNPKSLLKIYYTLVKAYNNGFFNNRIFRTFPYVHNYYKSFYSNDLINKIYNRSMDCNTSNSNNKDLNRESEREDMLLGSCSDYLNKNVNEILVKSFKDNFQMCLTNLMNKKLDDSTLILKLNIKLLIEFWLKNSTNNELIDLINMELNKHEEFINDLINKVSNRNFDSPNGSDSSNNLNELIDVFLLLVLTKNYNDDLILKFVDIINNNFNQFSVQDKLKIFFGLCNIYNNPSVSVLVNRLLVLFNNQIKFLQLNDLITLINSYRLISYQNNVLDKIVDTQLIPKFSNITIINLFIILDSFIQLDYRCSLFTKEINENYNKNLSKEDLIILKDKLQQLYQQSVDYL